MNYKDEWEKFKIAIFCNTFNLHNDKLVRERVNRDTYKCVRCGREKDIIKAI